MSEPVRVKAKIFGDGRVERITDNQPDTVEHKGRLDEIARVLGTTLRAYVNAAEKLLNGKYSNIRASAPIHLSTPGPILAVLGSDGVVIRFGTNTEPPGIVGATSDTSLFDLVPALSQNLIHCHRDRDFISKVSESGPTLSLETSNENSREVISTVRLGFDVVIGEATFPAPPSKPYCLLSVQNSMEIQMHGFLASTEDMSDEQPFITRSKVRLPLPWECIEVYPFFNPEHWKPEYAPIWAENDILAAVVSDQFRDRHFQTLDPKAAARREIAQMLKSYKELLDSNPEREESLQVFLRDHPFLLCPARVRMWPKLALGAHKTDFVFREAAGDYLVVEIEKSTHRLFLKDGHTSKALNHALGQVSDWKRYLEDNLLTAQNELGLSGISSNPKALVVLGRIAYLSETNRRKLVTFENQNPRMKIMTYDDVYDNAKATIENLLGPIWEPGGNTEVYYVSDVASPNTAQD